ncbi:sensor domain-containing diguanylate cyclase [Lichenifustis flavocetrariae]|uniref:diguanylate cyclase n=1 Tax=Lichenifustis flavocetrariae TaxID=2949735 RepID=A0AA41Z509_9HYPH|nr:sensor domain-containing diguanylate cyclase [Lichenifustis flavocetrariae]MCW6512915.1 sensor domain-containing diguanylate cyclase [Lichenifustis flavocetrariae]
MTDITTDVEREHSELLQFLYACPVGLIQADMNGRMTMLNPVAMQLLHRLGNASASMNVFAALEGYAPELRNMITSFSGNNGQICQGHRIHVGRPASHGNSIPMVLACTLVKLGPVSLMATLEDVSEQVAQEQRLKQADAWFASFLNGADEYGVVAIDADGRIQALDPVARQQTGFEEGDLVGAHVQVLDNPDPGSASMNITEEIEVARRDGWHLTEGWCAKRGGSRYRCQRLICVRGKMEVAAQIVPGYTVILRPLSHVGMDADQLRRRLTTDLLTGAYNRAHFFDVAEEEIRRCAQRDNAVGLICIDIDHFKTVNDTHGHAVGDLVLKAVAEACMGVLRSSGTFARLGGEEFTALLPSSDPSTTIEIAERLRAAIAVISVRIGELDLRVTASLGFAVRMAATVSLAELMQHADRALYAAKRSGRDRVVDSDAIPAAA